MTSIDTLSEIIELIEKLTPLADSLAENEKEIFEELHQKYTPPNGKAVKIGFDDKILLEVMLRNITVRKDLGML